MIERKAILAQINSVPSMPSVVMELRKYLSDPDVSFDNLAKVIEYDPGLTANILQLANSAYFGWSRKIKTVKEAIVRLGISRIVLPVGPFLPAAFTVSTVWRSYRRCTWRSQT